MRKTTRKMWAVAAGVTGVALLATACGSGDSGSSDDANGDEKITLTVATFNEFGYEDLIAEYEEANPNITVEHKRAATSNEARDNLNTRLAAGSGLSDVEAIEVDWLPELLQYSDKFVDLASEDVEGRWLDFKVAQATAEDGRLIGYGTDIGPEVIAYRSDLFAAAGLPTDREEVATLFGGEDASWDTYFEVGEKFKAAGTGVPFFDTSQAIFQGMVNQQEAAFEDPETGEIIALENPEVKAAYDAVTKASQAGLSAGKAQWSEDWNAAFQKNGFATMLAPGWMLGIIKDQAEGVAGWDIANVFPGGAGNWGGAFLTVPAQGEHPEEAKALAAWLTAPEQQIKAFKAKGTFPSQIEALESEDLLSVTDEFFNNAPTGQILSERAKAIPATPPFKGPNYFAISDAMSQAIGRVDVDKTDDPAASWAKFEEAVTALG